MSGGGFGGRILAPYLGGRGRMDGARKAEAREEQQGVKLSYAPAWMTTRPPPSTSTYGLWLSSSRIPKSGVDSDAKA